MTEAQKNQFLGECYFFRAFIYFDMEKFWGSVPYVDKALTIEDETYLPRTKRETIFDNILDDLQKSVDYFKAYGGTHTLGMVNEDVANAYISRVALYAANAPMLQPKVYIRMMLKACSSLRRMQIIIMNWLIMQLKD